MRSLHELLRGSDAGHSPPKSSLTTRDCFRRSFPVSHPHTRGRGERLPELMVEAEKECMTQREIRRERYRIERDIDQAALDVASHPHTRGRGGWSWHPHTRGRGGLGMSAEHRTRKNRFESHAGRG